jgi:hypothetical protein
VGSQSHRWRKFIQQVNWPLVSPNFRTSHARAVVDVAYSLPSPWNKLAGQCSRLAEHKTGFCLVGWIRRRRDRSAGGFAVQVVPPRRTQPKTFEIDCRDLVMTRAQLYTSWHLSATCPLPLFLDPVHFGTRNSGVTCHVSHLVTEWTTYVPLPALFSKEYCTRKAKNDWKRKVSENERNKHKIFWLPSSRDPFILKF